VPNNEDLQYLIENVGPIVSTSANLAGEPPAEEFNDAYATFGKGLDFYVDAGRVAGAPSTLVENQAGKLVVLRQGSVKIDGE